MLKKPMLRNIYADERVGTLLLSKKESSNDYHISKSIVSNYSAPVCLSQRLNLTKCRA